MRLNKLLASRGIGARRKCDTLIQAGKVRVNGEVVTEPGTAVEPQRDRIEVDGRPLPGPAPNRYYMLHKPVGVISTLSDPEGRRSLRDLLPPGPRLFPIGRLDADTSGLLLLTNDGELAHHLMHPRYGVTKRYRVHVDRAPNARELERLQNGVEFEPGVVSSPAQVWLRDSASAEAVIELALHEGRHRQVRHMCEAVGLEVKRLHRYGYGPLKLGDLSRGLWRELSDDEVAALRAASSRPQRRPAGSARFTGQRSFDRARPRPRSFEREQPRPRSFERERPRASSFERERPRPRSFERERPGPRSFERERPRPRSFDRARPRPGSFDRERPRPRSFERERPRPRSFERERPGPRSFERERPRREFPAGRERRPERAPFDRVRPDRARPNRGRPEAGRPSRARPDRVRPDRARFDRARPNRGRPEAGRPERRRGGEWRDEPRHDRSTRAARPTRGRARPPGERTFEPRPERSWQRSGSRPSRATPARFSRRTDTRSSGANPPASGRGPADRRPPRRPRQGPARAPRAERPFERFRRRRPSS